MSFVIEYLLWSLLDDAELDYARATMADVGADQEAAIRRSEKLRAIESEAAFFSGLARRRAHRPDR